VKLQVFCVFAGAAHHRAVIYVPLCQLSELIREFLFCFYTVFHLPIKTQHLEKCDYQSRIQMNTDTCVILYILRLGFMCLAVSDRVLRIA